MEGFINFISSPDWLTIFITAINTIAVVVIAVVQIRMQRQQTMLQKRQTEAQEYEAYRKLYPLVYSANYRITRFMNDMWTALWKPIYSFEGENFLTLKIQEIDCLIVELSKNRIDFELKFSKDFFDLNGYIETLSCMSSLGHYIEDSIKNGYVNMTEGVHHGTPDIKMDIVQHFTKTDMQRIVINRLDKFTDALKNTCINDNILDEIKKRCKIN